MRKIYCFFITALCFLSYSVALAQPGCSDLEITTVQNGSVCGVGSVTLSATASGTGDGILWYGSATGGASLAQGAVFETPSLSSTTSYWASEAILTGGFTSVGPTSPAIGVSTGSSIAIGTQRLYFDVLSPATIESVDIFPTAAVGSNGSVVIRDNTQTVLYTIPYTTTVTGGNTAQTIMLNASLSPGTEYEIGQGTAINLSRNSTGAVYPYTSPKIVITHNSFNTVYYYWYYNWKVSTLVVDCESPREEVIATVNNQADIDITTLPYSHTANTATYFNNYEGAPGADCGSTDAYLYGNDVVYKYTAEDDYILEVTLENVSEDYTAVFVYKSCADIGVTCVAEGSINENMGDHSFQMAVEDGEDYYFVISSAEPTDSFDYTFKLNGTTCTNYPAPTGAANQSFATGQTLADLDVTGLDLSWYSDAATTTVLTDDTVLVDTTTYYVTQTFQSCEGNVLAVTVAETACTVLEILSTEDNSVCGEGSVTLSAQATGSIVNTKIHWYDAAIGGNLIGMGTTFETPVLTETTSYWVAEVSQGKGGGTNSLLPTYCIPTFSTGCTAGDAINDFTLEDSFGSTLISHLSSGCSSGAYADYTADASLTATLEVGKIYSFEATHSTSSQYLQIWIDFDGNGSFEDVGELVYKATSAASTTIPSSGSFEIPQTAIGVNTVMRVKTTYSTANGNSCTHTTSWGEVHDYKVNIIGVTDLCESPRVEVIATVNEVADEIVNLPLPYTHTANTRDYDNNYFGTPGMDCSNEDYLDGHDVVYQFSPTLGGVYSIQLSGLSSTNAGVFVYESCYDIGTSCYAGVVSDGTTNDFGIDEVILNDGQDYFILISTKDSSSTDYTLTIDIAQIDCTDYTAAPEGEEEQILNIGSTLADTVIKGSNLIWYSDSALTSLLPNTTTVVDGTTYYVTQTLNGCESEYLEVTIYELDCDALEILSTTGATIVCKGTATLKAVGTEAVGTAIYWYDSETSIDHIHKGDSFQTPEIITTTSYWASEVALIGGELTGQGKPTYAPIASPSGYTITAGLEFTATESFVISSVVAYSNATTGTTIPSVELQTATGQMIQSISNVPIPNGGAGVNAVPFTIDLNFTVPGPGTYRLMATGSFSSLIRDSGAANAAFPHAVGDVAEITQGILTSSGSASYYYFYDWTIGGEEVICESPREEVVVTVTQDGHEIVGGLPYIHSENTGTYGNAYSGAPGVNCGIDENYLNGSEVVYMYTATEDDLLTIELTDLDDYYAGMFIYETCADIGEECMVGAVAGPTADDVVIQDFPVEIGKTYYIVVSSWLTDSIDYTLKINSFTCADLAAPFGDNVQGFVAGDTMEKLQAETTRVGAVLTWYADAGLTSVIADLSLVNLVDGDTYYVTQTLNDCESIALAIFAEEIDCSTLAIANYTEGTVVCRGAVTLKAEASGNGNQIYWYDSQTATDPIAIGADFTTPELTQSTSYWVAEVFAEEDSSLNPLPSYCTPPVTNCNVGDYIDDFILVDSNNRTLIEHLASGCSPGSYDDLTENSSLSATLIAGFEYEFTVTHGTGSQYVRIWIDLDGNGSFEDTGELVYHSTSAGSGSKPTVGTFIIPQNSLSMNTVMRVRNTFSTGVADSCTQAAVYGEVHDYKVTIIGATIICESPRQEIVATVDQTGDIQVNYTDLPYVDVNNTSLFANNFSGNAGEGCDGADYLNGYEAMYYYQADPDKDEILRIELSEVNNPSTALFIYNTCGEVGIDCVVGAKVANRKALIKDHYVKAGESFMIVISSATGTTDYTLDIDGMDCNNVAPPSGNPAPYFVSGDVVADVVVDGSVFNQGFKWYTDVGLTNLIVDPTIETLIDGTSYFVTQTLLGCESLAYEIVPMEFECGLMNVTPQIEDIYVCAPGGEITLKTTASGIGSEIFWYDAEVDGSYLGKGSEITFELDKNTSFWATEVYLSNPVVETQQAEANPPALMNSTANNGGLQFVVHETFTLESVTVLSTSSGGEIQVDIRDVDNNNDIVFTTKATIPGGGTTINSIPVIIPIDFKLDQGNYRILRATSGTTVGLGYMSAVNSSFPYTLGNNLGEVTTGSLLSSTSTLYYSFFDWTISSGDVICESTRTEYKIQLNSEIPVPPVVSPLQKICGNALLSEIIVLGENIQWYDNTGREIDKNSPIFEGQTYYVTQTVHACESAMTEVVMRFSQLSEQPVAAINQSFLEGETLSDLEVFGDNVVWYADRFKSKPLGADTKLIDQVTYYATQSEEGKCESTPLGITVHQTLNVLDVLFEHFEFYPNPVEERLFITNASTIEKIEVFELSGRKVLSNSYSTHSIILEVSELATGTYLLKATVDGMDKIFRIIKK